ncbi:hypothetical protein [Pseudomonas brassicacearum]|uniref:Uncharacterized protein n=1 Tax=Pseudomonas brassicacearum TaxID=930166 RepID=A0A423JSE0_9PSED|nr:hypothetical protein [Pseudomonas brassicacearum]RON40602.1 hypothetical protein BK664_08495 [Pseudomonas brassicacearum]
MTADIRAFEEAIGLNRIAPSRYSTYLSTQLFCQSVFDPRLSVSRVIAEIEALECTDRKSATKPAALFNRLPLKGLWHKHYIQNGISSMAINLRHAINKFGLPKFEQKVKDLGASGEERYLEASDIDEIVYEAVLGNYGRRYEAGQMTGEWMVYAIHEGQNYYLCLGTHKSGDDALRQQIDLICVPEFPFLKEILVSVT